MVVIRVLAVALAVLLALLLGILCYLHFADLNPYRERIGAMVSEATGRSFRMEGDLDLDLWPQVTFAANKLHLANADWGSEPDMAKVGHLSAQILPLSLLLGPIQVLDVELSDVELLVETSAEGQSNWTLGTAEASEEEEPEGSGEPSGINLLLDHAEIRELWVRQRGPDGAERTFGLASLTVQADEADQMHMEGQGTAMDMPLSLGGQLGTRAQLAETGDVAWELEASLGHSDFRITGKRTLPRDAAPGALDATVRADGLQALVDELEVPVTIPGPLDLAVAVSGDGQQVEGTLNGSLGEIVIDSTFQRTGPTLNFDSSLTPLEAVGTMFAVAGLPGEPLRLSGEIGETDTGTDIRDVTVTLGEAKFVVNGSVAGEQGANSLDLQAQGALLSELMATLPALPFELSTTVESTADALSLDPLKLQLGDTDVSGSLRVASGGRGAIEASLQSRRIDLVQLAGGAEDEGAAAEEAEASPAPDSPPDPNSPASRYVFTDAPLPFEALQGNEIDLNWSIEQLITPGVTLQQTDIAVDLHGGELDAELVFTGAHGGAGVNKVQLQTAGQNAELMLDSRLRDLRVNLVSGADAKPEDVPPLSLTVDVRASGTSARQLASGANGEILLTLGEGQMADSLLDRFSSDILAQLVSALNPFAEKDPEMELQCGVVAVDIDDGMSKVEPILIQSEKLQIVAAGSVDLKTEELELEFNTKPRSGVGVSADMFVTPFVSLTGTLASPGVGLNKSGALLTVGAAVATGGMSMLWQGVMDRTTGGVDRCEQVLKDHPQPPLQEES